MKSISNFFKSEVIFKSIVNEVKESLPTVDVSFDEWFNNLPNDKGEAEVVNISDVPLEDRFHNKVITVASTSLVAGYEKVNKEVNDKKYLNILVIVPFNNFYFGVSFKYRSEGTLDDIGVYVVPPKKVFIKGIINISKSVFEVYEAVYFAKHQNYSGSELAQKIHSRLDKVKFLDSIEEKYGAAAQEADAKSKEVTPDKSPFTLSKKKRFPSYIKHCLVKEKNNEAVKKYSYWGEAEIFVETVKKDKKNYYKVYMGDVRSSFDNGSDEMYTFYLTTLGSLDRFLEYCLKPNRKKMHSNLGADGEIHVWYSNMQKSLPPMLKKDCIKDENLIKELNFHDFDLYDLYKN